MTTLSRRTLLAGGAGLATLAVVRPSVADAGPRGPIVHHDRRVTFTFRSKRASSVEVVGGWISGWPQTPVPLREVRPGMWSVTVGPLAPDWYIYHFIVDGVATRDPKNPTVVPSSKLGETMFMVSGRATRFMEVQRVPHGRIKVLNYYSRVTSTVRQATVYLPPGYSSSGRRYRVFVLMHGGGGDQWDWIVQGRANVILDNAIAAGRVEPMVVVMPNVSFPAEVQTGLPKPEDDVAPTEIIDNLLPAVQQRFRVKRKGRNRALAGLSMGGLFTWDTLITRPGAFAYYGDFSSGFFPDGIAHLRSSDLLKNPKIDAATELHMIYCDPTDIAWTNNVNTRELFDDFGVRYRFLNQPGSQGHTWHTWRLNLRNFAPRLF